MAKKRRRKPGLQRCSVCGSYQLAQELEAHICLTCLGLVGVKRWGKRSARDTDESEPVGKAAAGAR